jgi:hypothetical protein
VSQFDRIDSPTSCVATPTPQPMTERERRLEKALTQIDNWLVCWPITTADDMAQSFEAMHQVATSALSAYTPPDAATPVAEVREELKQTIRRALETRKAFVPYSSTVADAILSEFDVRKRGT